MPLKVVRPKGRRYWYVVGSVAGTRIRESAKTTSRAVAESFRIKRETELEQKRIYGPQAVATFAEAVNMYLDRGGENRYLAPLLKEFGSFRVASLTQSDLDAGARALYPNAQPSTLNRQVYTPFIAVYNEAAINDLCPYRKWRRPKGHNAQTKFRWLWPAEAERLIEAAAPHLRPMIIFMLSTGARTNEVFSLKWEQVSLETGECWLWKTKTKSARKLELTGRAVAALAAQEHKNGPVFVGPRNAPLGNGVARGSIKTGFAGAVRRSGLERRGLTPHTLRHTFATWFYSATLDRERLKALGGWKSDQVDRYCHLAPREMGEELARYGWDFSGRTEREESEPEVRRL